jgi:hypothetical protein
LGKRSLLEDVGKTSVSSFNDDLVLTFPKYEKTCSLSTQLLRFKMNWTKFLHLFPCFANYSSKNLKSGFKIYRINQKMSFLLVNQYSLFLLLTLQAF